MIPISTTESKALEGLRKFFLAILPTPIEVIKGQVNRVPEPKTNDYVINTPTRRERFSTNEDQYVDTTFTASLADDQLIVTEILTGEIIVGSTVSSVHVADNTVILSGPGGVGTYTVSVGGQTVDPETMSTGLAKLQQSTELVVQVDVHGPASADNAQIISTAFRDDYAVTWFSSNNFEAVPLYADDPKQMPFSNDQQQVESRWMIEAHLQVKPVVSLPQQFAGEVDVTTIEVEATYPIEE